MSIADGALDRERMRALAFTDATAKRRLEGILHPLIGTEALRLAAESSSPAVVFDVPLLAKSSALARALRSHRWWSTAASRHKSSASMQRSGWHDEQVRRVIAQQAPRATRRAIADAVIDNDGPRTLQQLQVAAHALWALWVAQG